VVGINENYIYNLDSVPYTVRNVTDKEVSSFSTSFNINQHEVLGITIRSSYQDENIYLELPGNGQDKAVDFYVNVRNNADHAVRINLAMHSPAPWTMIDANGEYPSEIFLVESGTTACIHFIETRTFGNENHNQLLVVREGYDVKVKPLYSKQLITIPTGTVSYTVNIDDRTEYGVKVSDSDLTSLMLEFPDPVEGKVLDFIVDVDNSDSNITTVIHLSHNWFYAYDRFIEDWSNIFNIPSGTRYRYHFRETGLSKTSGVTTPVTHPVIYIEKLEMFMLGY